MILEGVMGSKLRCVVLLCKSYLEKNEVFSICIKMLDIIYLPYVTLHLAKMLALER